MNQDLEPPTWTLRDGTLRSPLLEAHGLVAGFTTRALGSMAGSVYPETEQAANRDALARRLGFDAIARVKQVHGNSIVRADRAVEPRAEADGMWTDRAGVLLGIAAADCVPVLVADGAGRMGAAHAGWQGTMLGVAGSLIAALKADGADTSQIVAALGPSIGPCCYVIDESRAKMLRRLGDHVRERQGGIVFDLWSANLAQLESYGVRDIEVAGICTKCGGRDLWSYRARDAEGRYGTQLAFLGRPP